MSCFQCQLRKALDKQELEMERSNALYYATAVAKTQEDINKAIRLYNELEIKYNEGENKNEEGN